MAFSRLSLTRRDLLRVGPTLKVLVRRPSLETPTGAVVAEPVLCTGLIDTGSSITIVTPTIATGQQLKVRDRKGISTIVADQRDCPVCSARIEFPNLALRPIDPVEVVVAELRQREFAVLIGRDILQYWTMRYDGRSAEVTVED